MKAARRTWFEWPRGDAWAGSGAILAAGRHEESREEGEVWHGGPEWSLRGGLRRWVTWCSDELKPRLILALLAASSMHRHQSKRGLVILSFILSLAFFSRKSCVSR